MAGTAMETERGELARAMDALASFLRAHGEHHWGSRIEDDLHLVRKGDVFGAQRFLGYFGGMGSLNDVWLCKLNEHTVPEGAESRINRELDRLKSTAWQLASSVATKAI